jgi:hypothetical protein
MEIEVKRRGNPATGAQLGEMFINSVRECFTLEDEVRETADPVTVWKVPGKTAIPRGRYQVIVNKSARFKRLMPLLVNVPGFSGVRIHPGNDAADTEGCILIGQECAGNLIFKSRAAFAVFFPKLQAALAQGEPVFCTVS